MGEMFGRDLVGESFCNFHLKRAISIVFSNWENPICGVKEINVEILRTVFITLSKVTPRSNAQDNVLNLSSFLRSVMRKIPWRMKSKYLMLTSLLPQYGAEKVCIYST
jgi:hypothetical protein